MTLALFVILHALHAHLLMLVILVKELWFKKKSKLDIVIAPIKENGKSIFS